MPPTTAAAHLEQVIDTWRIQLAGWDAAAAPAEDEHPRALPLVVRAEKNPAPGHTETLEAAATAVVHLLTDERCLPGGPWHEPVRAWMDGKIRKVARRTRGTKWETTQALPGVTATIGGASVRALPPTPVGDVPAPVGSMQVSGLELTDAAPPAAPSGPGLRILLAPDVAMTTGKACAQVGHAAQLALTLPRERVLAWAAAGFPLTVRTATTTEWEQALAGDPGEVVVVTDAGFTEVAFGTTTCAATLTA